MIDFGSMYKKLHGNLKVKIILLEVREEGDTYLGSWMVFFFLKKMKKVCQAIILKNG